MHTATLKSGEGSASKAAHSPARQQFPGLALRHDQEGQGGGRAWAAGKTLGLKKTLLRQTQTQVHGKKGEK